MYGVIQSSIIFNFFSLLLIGTILSFIFVALSFIIALKNENKIKGFGFAIVLWLFLAIIYDGLFPDIFLVFNDYPLDKFSLFATLFNPIDLSRILDFVETRYFSLAGIYRCCFRKIFWHTVWYVSIIYISHSLGDIACMGNSQDIGEEGFLG